MREITADEVGRLRECLEALAAHHNKVSNNFQGFYPNRSHETTLAMFREVLQEQSSRVAVVEKDGRVAGFCKVDMQADKGKLEYLVVLPDFRKQGYGKALMDWGMETLRRQGVKQIEVKVVDGNDAIELYKSYGFQINAQILLKLM